MPIFRPSSAAAGRRSAARAALAAGLLLAAGTLAPRLAAQALNVAGASSAFNPVVTPGGTIMTDPFNDQQTGQNSSDFISFTAGTAVYSGTTALTAPSDVPGFLVSSGQISGDATNTYLAFRFLFQGANGSQSYSGSYNMVGVDLDQNGSVDIIFGADSTGKTPKLIFLKPGTGTNTSPSTTTVGGYTTSASTALTASGGTAPVTFDYSANGTQYNATGKNSAVPTNMNLTFAISYANLQQAIRDLGTVNGTNFSTFTVTATTAMNFLAYTSTNPNAFNQDIYGGNIAQNSSATWSSLGAFSTTFDASGTLQPTPEFATFAQAALLLLAGAGVYLWRGASGRRRPAAGVS